MSCDSYDCEYAAIQYEGYIQNLTRRITELQADSTKMLLELRELRKWKADASMYMGQVVSTHKHMLELRRELLGVELEVVK